MFLHSVSPTGDYTNIDLAALPLWRIGLGAKSMSHTKDGSITHVVLILGYPANVPGGVSRIILAAVDTKTSNEAEGIAGVGLPHLDLEGNRRRLHEAAKSLFNIEELRKEADVISAKISQLADLYHGIIDACGAEKATNTDLSAPISSVFKGELEAWRFAVTPGRFDPWRGLPNTFKPANAVATLGSLSVPPPIASAPVAPIASPQNPPPNIPPPPGANYPSPQRASRESRRKAAEENEKKARAEWAEKNAKPAPEPEAPAQSTPEVPDVSQGDVDEPEVLKVDEEA